MNQAGLFDMTSTAAPMAIDNLVERLGREEFNLVAVGRALLQDSQWLQKVREGRTEELAPFSKASLATLS